MHLILLDNYRLDIRLQNCLLIIFVNVIKLVSNYEQEGR